MAQTKRCANGEGAYRFRALVDEGIHICSMCVNAPQAMKASRLSICAVMSRVDRNADQGIAYMRRNVRGKKNNNMYYQISHTPTYTQSARIIIFKAISGAMEALHICEITRNARAFEAKCRIIPFFVVDAVFLLLLCCSPFLSGTTHA